MTIKFAVYITDQNDKPVELLFESAIPVNYDPNVNGPRVTLEDLQCFCETVNNNHHMIPAFRLELQRIALLAEPEVIQFLAAKVGR